MPQVRHTYAPSPDNHGFPQIERCFRLSQPNSAIRCSSTKSCATEIRQSTVILVLAYLRALKEICGELMRLLEWKSGARQSRPTPSLLFNFVIDEVPEHVSENLLGEGIELTETQIMQTNLCVCLNRCNMCNMDQTEWKMLWIGLAFAFHPQTVKYCYKTACQWFQT